MARPTAATLALLAGRSPAVLALAGAIGVASPAAPSLAQEIAKAPVNQVAASAPPMQPQMISLSLMDALIAVGAQDLAGVFGFIPDANTAPAFADYLLHERGALKKFVKKGKKDLKETGGVNEWDRLVAMYLIQINGSPALPPGIEHLPKKVEYDVSEIVLAQPLTLQEMTARRGMRR